MPEPIIGVMCGNGICEGTEATTCPADCDEVLSCVLAECETDDDCATGYECEAEPIGGTGGTNGPVCGDGLCTSGETEENCATDCTATRRCSPVHQLCGTDADCAPGFYCSFDVSGSGGASSGGAGGTSGSSSGGASGSGNDAALVAGVCTPEGEGGSGGSGGTVGSGGIGSGGVGTGGMGTGAVGTGGLATGGAPAGGSMNAGGTTSGGASGTSGSSGTGSGGDGATSGGGSSGTGSGGGGQSGSANGAGGTASGAETNDPGAAERGGCSVSRTGTKTSFAELGVLALILARLARRRRQS
jgi:hypothetical protein